MPILRAAYPKIQAGDVIQCWDGYLSGLESREGWIRLRDSLNKPRP